MRFAIPAAALAAGATIADAAHNITVTNNATSVQYTGGDWKPYTNCGGTQYTYTTGQFFTFNFVGTAIYLIGTASLSGGEIGIQLDSDVTSYDRYATLPYRCGVEWFAKDGLANTTHTLTVTMQGNSAENATTEGFLEWQWLVYTQLDATDLSAASSSSLASLSSASVATTASTSSSPTHTTPAAKSSSNGAAIGGGIAAAVVILLVLAGALFWYCRRDTSSSSTYPTSRPDLGGESQPFQAYGAGYQQGVAPVMAQNTGPNPMTIGIAGTTPWMPDASERARLGPQVSAGSPSSPEGASNYPFYPPSNMQTPISTHSTQPLLFPGATRRQSTSDPYPSSLNPTSTQHAPTSSAPVSQSGSGSGGGLGDSDVDRIAARVASLMVQNQGQPTTTTTTQEYDAPPPMYNEKH